MGLVTQRDHEMAALSDDDAEPLNTQTGWECLVVGPTINQDDGPYIMHPCSNGDCPNVSCVKCTQMRI